MFDITSYFNGYSIPITMKYYTKDKYNIYEIVKSTTKMTSICYWLSKGITKLKINPHKKVFTKVTSWNEQGDLLNIPAVL